MKPPLPSLLLGILLATFGTALPDDDLPGDDLLRAAKEPALVSRAGTEEYRLTYSPSFSTDVLLRVSKTGDRISLRAVHFAGSYPQRILTDKTVAITPAAWQHITTLVEASRFWTLPDEDKSYRANDGTSWTIEGARPTARHAVTRPNATYMMNERNLQQFVLLARYLMTLSCLKVTMK